LFTRPADRSAYTALDTIANATSGAIVATFSNIGRVNGGSGYIVGARLLTDQKTNTARYRLHLYRVSPTAINDNSPFTLLWANYGIRIGKIDINNVGTEDASNSTAAVGSNYDIRLPFQCQAGDKNIYGILETLTAFTPASAQNFFLELARKKSGWRSPPEDFPESGTSSTLPFFPIHLLTRRCFQSGYRCRTPRP